MRNKTIQVIFLALLFSVVYINYKHYNASTKYSFLMYEYNRGSYAIPLSIFEEFDNNLPNITSTTLPIMFLKARYLMNIDSTESAIKLLKKSKNVNPYLMAAEGMIAKIFYEQEEYDSAYYYGSKSFYTNPNNRFHRSLYFLINEKRNDTIELTKAFNTTKQFSDIENTLDYVVKMNKMGGQKLPLIKILDSISEIYQSEKDKKEIKLVQTLLDVGGYGIQVSVEISQFADQYFNEKNYLLAADLYEKAFEYDPNDYVFIENAALSYYLAEDYENAERSFKVVINDFDINTGKTEFYYGVMLETLNRLEESCIYLKKAADLKFAAQGSVDIYQQVCN